MKVILLVLAMGSIYLSGCDGSNDEHECGSDTSCAPFPADDIVGLWDRSIDIEGASEVLYTYIGADGSLYVYDFQQDDFGSGENCFTLISGIITRFTVTSNIYDVVTEDGVDTIGISERLTIDRQNSGLLVRRASGNEETWARLVGVEREDLLLC